MTVLLSPMCSDASLLYCDEDMDVTTSDDDTFSDCECGEFELQDVVESVKAVEYELKDVVSSVQAVELSSQDPEDAFNHPRNIFPSKMTFSNQTKEDLRHLGAVDSSMGRSLEFFLLHDEILCPATIITEKFIDVRNAAISIAFRLHTICVLRIGSTTSTSTSNMVSQTPNPYVVMNSMTIWALFVRILDKFLVRGTSDDAIQKTGTFNVWSDDVMQPRDVILLRSYACVIYVIAWKVHISAQNLVPYLPEVCNFLSDYCKKFTPTSIGFAVVGNKQKRDDDEWALLVSQVSKATLKELEWTVLFELDWGVNLDTSPDMIGEILKEYCDNPKYLILHAKSIELCNKVAMNAKYTYDTSTSLVRTTMACMFEAMLQLKIDAPTEFPEFVEMYHRLKIGAVCATL